MDKRVGKLIKRRRKHFKLTQEELAKKLNVSPSMVSYWETYKGMPDKELIPSICKVLKIKEKKFDDVKYKEQQSKFKIRLEKILMSISIFIIMFILLSTFSTLIINGTKLNSQIYDEYCFASRLKEVDKKEIEEANKNLEIIKSSSNSKFSENDKKRYVDYLEKMKVISEEISKNGIKQWCNKPKNGYESIIGLSKLKYVVIYGVADYDIKANNNNDVDLSIYRISSKYNKIISKKNGKNIREIDYSKAINLTNNRIILELSINQKVSNILFPKYKYINLNSISEIGMEPIRYIKFSYSEYYLELTKYIMEVGGINE